MIKNYLQWLENIKWATAWTLKTYRIGITCYNSYINWDILNATMMDIENFITMKKNEWCSITTTNRYLATIKCFYKYCFQHDIRTKIDHNKIIYSKQTDRKIDACSYGEINKLIKTCLKKHYSNITIKYRDLAIIYTLMWTWIRVSELVNIKVSDLKNDFLQIKWKWWKVRTVPFPRKYKQYAINYVKMREIKSEYVFCSHGFNYTWNKISTATIEQIIRDLSKCAWIDKIRPHKIRHTYATMLLRKWVSIFHIQNLLWHSHLDTTQKYLTCYNEDLVKAVSKLPSF